MSSFRLVGLPDEIGARKISILEVWEQDGNRKRLKPVSLLALVQLGSLSGIKL